MNGWLSAFNSPGAAAYRKFAQTNWPSGATLTDQLAELRATTGGFDLRKIEAWPTSTKIVALVQERNSGRFGELTLEVGAARPYRISRLTMRSIPRPAEFAQHRVVMAELTTALGEKLQEETAADRFSGAVLIAENGKPVFARAYGLADRERKIPNALRTRFRIGSMNKMFTAVATLQLVQAGKLRLDAPLVSYLPEYPNHDLAAKVTIHQLLTHTAGTGDIFGPEFEAHRLELRTLDDYVRLYGKRAPEYEPGDHWEYSNYGFILLGAVIEKVSGEAYDDYMRKHVFEPAEMASTGSEPEDRPVPDRSAGYTDVNGTLQRNTETLPYRGTSAGGGYATVEDLLRFANALRGTKLLDRHYTELLTSGKVDIPQTARRYAYGFENQSVNGTRCFGHNGGAPGMNANLEICSRGRYVVAVAANRDPAVADELSSFITRRLPKN